MAEKIFDRKILKLHRDRIIDNFENYNFLYHEFADRIIENCQFLNRDFAKILEIGANDQYLQNKIQKIYSKSNFIAAKTSKNTKGDLLIDDEFLPFKNQSFDLIINNFNFHFLNEIPFFLSRVKEILMPNGVFIATFFGEENLSELAHAIYEAENEIYGQTSPRMPPTINIKTAANLLQKSGFENPISNFEKIEIEYSNPITLLHDLKGMGQSNILHKRAKKFISKKFIEKICQKLQELYGNENKSAIKVNFEVITITGWKFDPNVKKLEIKET